MLKLVIAGSDAAAPPVGAADAGVQVWHGHDGRVFSYGYTVDGQYWIQLPSVASFGFHPDSDQVVAVPEQPSRLAPIHDLYYRVVLPMALQALGREALHASAVRTPRGVIALCGESGTGKSTAAYGLSQRGYGLWTDDAVVVEMSHGRVGAIPLPFKIRLRPASASFFGQQPTGVVSGVTEFSSDQIHTEPAPLALVCLLSRSSAQSGDAVTATRRLAPSEAFPAVLVHATCFNLHDVERKRRMAQQYLELVVRVPVVEIRFHPAFEALPALLDQIERVIRIEACGLA